MAADVRKTSLFDQHTRRRNGRNFNHQPLPVPSIRSHRRRWFEIYIDGLCSDIYCGKHPHPRRATFDRYIDRKRKLRRCTNTSQNCETNRVTTTPSDLSHIAGCPNGLRHPIFFGPGSTALVGLRGSLITLTHTTG